MACGNIVSRGEIMEETLALSTLQTFIFDFIHIVFQRWSLFTTMEVQKILWMVFGPSLQEREQGWGYGNAVNFWWWISQDPRLDAAPWSRRSDFHPCCGLSQHCERKLLQLAQRVLLVVGEDWSYLGNAGITGVKENNLSEVQVSEMGRMLLKFQMP